MFEDINGVYILFAGKRKILTLAFIAALVISVIVVAFTGPYKELCKNYPFAFMGSVNAQVGLAKYYANLDGKDEEALFWFKKAAEKGRIEEFSEYAWRLVRENDPNKFDVLKEVAIAGDADACSVIAEAYLFTGFDQFRQYIKKPDPAATEWWHDKAIEQAEKIKNKDLLFLLLNRTASLYLAFDKQFVSSKPAPDHKKALSYLDRAKKISENESVYELGMIYLYGGYGVEKDEKKVLSTC